MNATQIMYAIASVGVFASRSFLPAFITALLMRYGGEWFGDIAFFEHMDTTQNPSWFTHGATIIVLGANNEVLYRGHQPPEDWGLWSK